LDVVDLLDKSGIPYAVIGAMAASVHGIVRGSVDADAVVSISVEALTKLEERFKSFGLITSLRQGAPDDPIAALLQLTDAYENRVDLLAGLRGLDSEAFARVIKVPFERSVLHVIGLEDFIASKVFAGGPQDLEDVRQALAVSGDRLNRDLAKRLARGFGKDTAKILDTLLAK
jgi:hypothetical protein